MTQNTEQDRTEFEARFKHLDLTQEPDAWGAPRYKHNAISLAWDAWQAARRAPAVTVPQSIEQMAVDRYKVVPSHESMFHRWAVVAGNGTQQLYIGREAECQNMARKFTGAFLDGAFVALATAPRPPEAQPYVSNVTLAAPVELPEPVYTMRVRGRMHDYTHTLSAFDLADGEHALYTEQQVRQLLAYNGNN